MPLHLNEIEAVVKRHKPSSITIILIVSIAALLLIFIFIMGLLKFLRFKIKRRSKRVEDLPSPSSDSLLPLPFLPQRFNWDEIVKLSMNFSTVIGQGGFSTIYLAYFSDSSLGAIKIHRNSERLNRIFKQELEILLQLRHQNIVNLLGYCDEREEEGALVFEHIPNGTLHDKLFGVIDDGKRNEEVLSWNSRISIAFQLASAIDYLHHNCTLPIVHGDIKASNLLLDHKLNVKLCDFGFAKMGFSSTLLPSSSSSLMGSPGYVDPHYLKTGIASKKNDVYSFGVIILELITGIQAFCSEKEQLLTSLLGPLLLRADAADKVMEMVDPRLASAGGDFNPEEVMVMASISALCLRQQTSLRPSMGDILKTMTEKISAVTFFVASQSDKKQQQQHV